MKKNLLLFILLFIPIFIYAQTQSLGFYVNALHNFSYLDKNSDREESIKLPILVLPSYALEYHKIKPNRKFGLHASLGVVWEGIRIKRSFRPIVNGTRLLNLTIGSTISGLGPSLRFGIFKQHKSIRIGTGVHFRYISNSFVGIFGPSVFDNESYQVIAEFEYIVNSNVHSSLYINVDYKLFKLDRNEIRLNFIGNIGLHPIYRTTDIIEDFIKNETKRIVHNNYGTYIGLGFKLVRSTDGKFKELFNFQWE